MKKLRLSLALFLLVILVTGCGGGGKKVKTESGEAVIGKDKVEVKDETGKMTVGANVELPESYPKDLVPLLKPVAITAVSESNEGGIVVLCASKAGVKEAIQYYSSIMEGAIDGHVASGSDFGLVAGIKAGKEINISITPGNEKDGVNTLISIAIKEGDSSQVQVAAETGSNPLQHIQIQEEKGEFGDGVTDGTADGATDPAISVDLPATYPKELVPLFKVARIDFVAESNRELQVEYLSQAALKEVVEYYQGILATANDKTTVVGSEAALIGGKMKGKDIMLEICHDDTDTGKSKILISIMDE